MYRILTINNNYDIAILLLTTIISIKHYNYDYSYITNGG